MSAEGAGYLGETEEYYILYRRIVRKKDGASFQFINGPKGKSGNIKAGFVNLNPAGEKSKTGDWHRFNDGEIGEESYVTIIESRDLPEYWYYVTDERGRRGVVSGWSGKMLIPFGEFDYIRETPITERDYPPYTYYYKGKVGTPGVLPAIYDKILGYDSYEISGTDEREFSYLVSKDGKVGLVGVSEDEMGNTVVKELAPFIYDDGFLYVMDRDWPMRLPFYGVWKGEKFGALDESGNEILPVEYDSMEFLHGSIILRKGNLVGAMTIHGEELFPAKYPSSAVSILPSEDMICVNYGGKKVYYSGAGRNININRKLSFTKYSRDATAFRNNKKGVLVVFTIKAEGYDGESVSFSFDLSNARTNQPAHNGGGKVGHASCSVSFTKPIETKKVELFIPYSEINSMFKHPGENYLINFKATHGGKFISIPGIPENEKSITVKGPAKYVNAGPR